MGEKITKKRPHESDDLSTTKRRKTAEPKPRVTQHLRLGSSPDSLAIGQKAQLDTLLKVLRKRQKIVVIAGAGISVSAGSTSSFRFIFYPTKIRQFLISAPTPGSSGVSEKSTI